MTYAPLENTVHSVVEKTLEKPRNRKSNLNDVRLKMFLSSSRCSNVCSNK